MGNYAIIVAGGTGNRMGNEVPKQFMLLNGKPVLMYSIEQFYKHDKDTKIIVVLHPSYLSMWVQLCNRHSFFIAHKIVKGGETRYQSVKNGLDTINGEGLVAVHDAARPLASVRLIDACFAAAIDKGSAIPGIPVNETVRMIKGDAIELINRNNLRIIQTPQVFQTDILREAYKQPYREDFTDDASLLEAMGVPINLVAGEPGNIKITLPADLEIASLLLKIAI